MTAPVVTADPLDALDAGDPFAGAGVPDPVGAAVLGDPALAQHVEATTAAGREAARGALSRLRIEAVSAAENAAAPYVRLRAELDAAFKAGRLHERFGNDGALALRAYDVEKAGLDRDRAAAVKDAVAALHERLDGVVATITAEAAHAGEPVALTPDQSRAMTDVLTLLPHLSPAEQVGQLEAVVAAAVRDPARRPTLRHLQPLLRSLAEKPEFARATDVGLRLYVAAQRAAVLTRDHRHYAAEAIRRYAGVLSYELGLVEAAVVEHGAWHGSRAANRQALDGRPALRVAIAPPAKDAPRRWAPKTA